MEKRSTYIAGVLKSLIFGFSFLFTKRLLINMSLLDLLSFRFLLAVAAFEVLRLTKVIKIDLKNKNMKRILLIVFIQPVGYYVFETLGLQRTSTLMSGILISFMPLIVLLMEALILKEKTSFLQKVYLAVSIAGVLLITALSGGGGGSSLLGIFFILLALICEGFFSILTRGSSTMFTPMEITYCMMWASAVTFNAANIVWKAYTGNISQYFTPLLNTNNLFGFFYLGILCSCAGYLLYNYMLSRIQASTVSVFAGLTTMTTVAAGVIFNNESFFWYHLTGGILILLGVWGTTRFTLSGEYLAEKPKDLADIK